jgi:hypothetical protein
MGQGVARPQAYPVYGQMESTDTGLVNSGSNKHQEGYKSTWQNRAYSWGQEVTNRAFPPCLPMQ